MHKINLTNRQYERLTVIEEHGRNKHGHVMWLCRCVCGKVVIVSSGSLNSQNTKSCGCLQQEQTSLTNSYSLLGQHFGRLTVQERCGSNKTRHSKWKCICDCGEVCIVSSNKLLEGHTQSCGCLRSENGSRVIQTNRFKNNGNIVSKSCKLFLDAVEEQYKVVIKREHLLENKSFDGQIGDVLIEVDGQYWHSRTKERLNDAIKNDIARKHGYYLYRFQVNNIQDIPRRLHQYASTLFALFDSTKHSTLSLSSVL